MSKHTPGPWKVLEGVSTVFIESETGAAIADLYQGIKGHAEFHANGRLIAAAPDLLDACKKAIADHEAEQGSDMSPAIYQALLDAVAKAEAQPS